MNVLIACEESQEVCKAFRERGHNAYSADLQECSGGHPEWHIQGDVLPILDGNCIFQTADSQTHIQVGSWDLIIAHPPCTYLSNAGAKHLYKKIDGETYMRVSRYNLGMKGKEFFVRMLNADCERICVENPIPSSVYQLPPYTQVVQPYEYGHPYSKKTCLWLKGLPKLVPTQIIDDYIPYTVSGMYAKTHDPKYKGVSLKGGGGIKGQKQNILRDRKGNGRTMGGDNKMSVMIKGMKKPNDCYQCRLHYGNGEYAEHYVANVMEHWEALEVIR